MVSPLPPEPTPSPVVAKPKHHPDVAKDEPPKPSPKPEEKKPDDKSKVINPFDTGTVSLKSSPSCEIFVDGKAIAASTPQDLKLAPGKHRITLVHDELDIKDAFNVEVKAGEVERVNRDLREKAKAKQRDKTINPFGGGG